MDDTLQKQKTHSLTGTKHGDAANDLLDFYFEKARELEEHGQYFMAAIALCLAKT